MGCEDFEGACRLLCGSLLILEDFERFLEAPSIFMMSLSGVLKFLEVPIDRFCGFVQELLINNLSQEKPLRKKLRASFNFFCRDELDDFSSVFLGSITPVDIKKEKNLAHLYRISQNLLETSFSMGFFIDRTNWQILMKISKSSICVLQELWNSLKTDHRCTLSLCKSV
ncbi:unnamed protein product [Moneuplotes crassus]|uniref:Uncharacterized protein n=1 Tax=Euplotes crassus TaxID=5936 RepID=A0AAD2D4H0_EUPCR|nr:unnamed protein product [Moneuplotes crassus]